VNGDFNIEGRENAEKRGEERRKTIAYVEPEGPTPRCGKDSERGACEKEMLSYS
jgi:hypothetical protein